MTGFRHRGEWNVVLIFASITAVLVLAALVTALTIDPPALGWIGFLLASAVVVGVAAAAAFLVPRARVSAPVLAIATDPVGGFSSWRTPDVVRTLSGTRSRRTSTAPSPSMLSFPFASRTSISWRTTRRRSSERRSEPC